MAEQMTKLDWDLKDRRIVRQSMLKASVEWHKDVTASTVEQVLETAEQFVDWVYEVTSLQSPLPEPTESQQQALNKVKEQTGWNKEQVFKQFERYPTEGNVDSCIKVIKGL